MMKRVEWDFPLSRHESKRHERNLKIEEEFAKVKKIRNE